MADTKVLMDKLNEENYDVWCFKMELLLRKEDLFGMVQNPKPERADGAWELKDGKARAMIGLAVEDCQLVHIIRKSTAKEMWDSLKGIHAQSSLSTALHVLRKLCSLRLSEEGNLPEHLNEMTALQNRLEVMEEGLKDRVFMALILSSLPPSYGSLINVIENRSENELTVEFIKCKLRDEWRRRQECNGSVSEQALVIVEKSKWAPGKMFVCYFCKREGHFRRDCAEFRKSLEERKSGAKVNVAAEMPVEMEMCLGVAQGCGKNRWYLDSGATSHMTNSSCLLDGVDPTKKLEVYLADGKRVLSRGAGKAKLALMTENGVKLNVSLKQVYHVPKLAGNLLSVGKICDLGYTVLFEREGCKVLKDREVMFEGKRQGGLYELKEFPERA